MPTSMPCGSETILLVEDEEAVHTIARRVLTREGYTVIEARNGKEAMATATHHPGPIQLVLSDVVMPEMSGNELAQRMRTLRPNAKMLLMSGHTDGDIVRRGVLAPGVAFVQKPFSPAGLLQLVRETLDRMG